MIGDGGPRGADRPCVPGRRSGRGASAGPHLVAAAVAVIAALVPCGCGDDAGGLAVPAGPRVAVTVDPALARGALDGRFPGFAFDSAQFSGGAWWRAGVEERVVSPPPDLESPVLRRLASELAPTTVRVGGTDCDGYFFCEGEGDCELPPRYADVFLEDDRVESTLTHESVRRVGAFAAAIGGEVLWCLNAGPGPRDPGTGAWIPDDARRLVRYARGLPTADVFRVWELGNEVNSLSILFDMPAPVGPVRYADDLEALHAMLAEEAPGSRLVAPGSYVSPFAELPPLTGPLVRELRSRGRLDLLDALSFHLYATQSTGCPVQIDPAEPGVLHDDALGERLRDLTRYFDRVAGELPVWNTESASAQCGGQRDLSDGQHDALWYADWIGLMAEEGSSRVIRHALVGADYSLLEPDTFEPRPTFLTLVLLRRTIRDHRLATVVDRSGLRAHGFCAAGGGDGEAVGPGAVSVVLTNPGPEARVAEVSLAGEGAGVGAARRWEVAPLGGDPVTRVATLEGELAGADGSIPRPAGRRVPVRDGTALVEVPAWSVVVTVLEPAGAALPGPVCDGAGPG